MKVDRNILRDIDANLRRLCDLDSTYRNAFYKRRKNYLETLAGFHSAALEDPISAKLGLIPGYRGRVQRKKLKDSQKTIQEAYRALQREKDPIAQESFAMVNGIILNNGNTSIGPTPYRNARVTLGLKYTPPNYVKVPELMTSLTTRLHELQKDNKCHPIELAIDAHFGIASIQPFPDGNKRTARLVQARILDLNGYPVPVIPFGERGLYLNLFDKAALVAGDTPDRYNPNHTLFADYLASKVNLSLERILGRSH